MEDNKLNVNLNGDSLTIDVFDILENPDLNKQYIIYGIEGNDKDVYVSELNENDLNYTLNNISSEEELKLVEHVLRNKKMN